MIVLHQKVKDAATDLTAKAVINTLFIVHRERGGLLAMERA
jgi:hypothetical protein